MNEQGRPDRRERLRNALRDNLKRRKAQARARSRPETATGLEISGGEAGDEARPGTPDPAGPAPDER